MAAMLWGKPNIQTESYASYIGNHWSHQGEWHPSNPWTLFSAATRHAAADLSCMTDAKPHPWIVPFQNFWSTMNIWNNKDVVVTLKPLCLAVTSYVTITVANQALNIYK